MGDIYRTFSQAMAHPLVAEAVFNNQPAWVWSATGESILWTNEAGCRFFQTKSISDLLSRTFRRISPATVQIARMCRTATLNEPEQCALRFYRGMNPVTISARLVRIKLADGQKAIFVAAMDFQGNKKRKPGKMGLRLMKLFSRGEASAALLSPDGQFEFTSRRFDEKSFNTEIIEQTVRTLTDNDARHERVVIDGYAVHFCRIGSKKHGFSYIFVTVEQEKAEDDEETAPCIPAAGIPAAGIPEACVPEVGQPSPEVPESEAVDTVVPEIPGAEHDSAETVLFEDEAELLKPSEFEDNPELYESENVPLDKISVDDDEVLDKPEEKAADLPDISDELPAREESEESASILTSKPVPSRFLFELDESHTIISLSPEFSEKLGAETGDVVGENWADVAGRYNLDLTGLIARHLGRQVIWTETVFWPISETATQTEGPLRAPVTLTAMPVFNSERDFEGFRGFGSIDLAGAAVHFELDEPPVEEEVPETEDDFTEESEQDHWNVFKSATPLPEAGDEEDTKEKINEVEPQDTAINISEITLDDKLERDWDEDARDDENADPGSFNSPEDHRSHENLTNKVIPLHRRPVALRSVSEEEGGEPSLSKPERHAFEQIADALSVRIEGQEVDGPFDATREANAEMLSKTDRDDDEPDIAPKDTAEPGNGDTNSDQPEPGDEGGFNENIDNDAASVVEGYAFQRKNRRRPTLDERAEEHLNDAMASIETAPTKVTSSDLAKGLGAGATAIFDAGDFNADKTHDLDDEDHTLDEKGQDIVGSHLEDLGSKAGIEAGLNWQAEQEAKSQEDLASTHPMDREITLFSGEDGILNRLPLGLIVSRNRSVLFANPSVLDFLGYENLEEFRDAGGINTLFKPNIDADPGSFVGRDMLQHLVITADQQDGQIPLPVRVKMADGSTVSVDLRLQSGDWRGAEALLMALTAKVDDPEVRLSDEERISRLLGQSTDIMDIASDGVLIIDEACNLVHANASAEALFGRDRREMRDLRFSSLFAEESQKSINDYVDGLTSNGVESVLNDGREVIAREVSGGLIPLFITIGRLENAEQHDNRLLCVVLRDITQWKRAEEELIESRRVAENANAQKSDFLAKVSHEIRTPLNAIIGFSEVMVEERFGAIDNPRYLEYIRDIHNSGTYLVSLVNDLLDLSKIEAGKLDLAFSSVAVNPLIQECVALMQPDANRERIIIRTSLAEALPPIVADARSIRQIALNLLSNAIKFTNAGGQIIVSTAFEESGEVVIRVRDTGIGMSEKDLEYAMQPFRQVGAGSHGHAKGTGLGLPLTKALVEANRAIFNIDSRLDYGTLIQVIFPNERVLAQ